MTQRLREQASPQQDVSKCGEREQARRMELELAPEHLLSLNEAVELPQGLADLVQEGLVLWKASRAGERERQRCLRPVLLPDGTQERSPRVAVPRIPDGGLVRPLLRTGGFPAMNRLG